MMKRNKMTSDDLGYWHVEKPFRHNEVESVDDRERSIALSVSLLRKNRQVSSLNRIRLPSHTVTSPSCQCRRSFHLFCTDLFDEKDAMAEMINLHPAPHNHDRDPSRRLPMSHKKHYHGVLEEVRPERPVTAGPERCAAPNAENQTQDKKPRMIPPKAFARPSTSHSPAMNRGFDRSAHTAHRLSKQLPSLPQLHTRALSITNQYSHEVPTPLPGTPPSSPKTPPDESSTLSPYSIAPGSLRVAPLTLRARNGHESRKELASASPPSKISQYEDYAREYLSTVELYGETNDKAIHQLPLSTTDRPLSRSGVFVIHANTANTQLFEIAYKSLLRTPTS